MSVISCVTPTLSPWVRLRLRLSLRVEVVEVPRVLVMPSLVPQFLACEVPALLPLLLDEPPLLRLVPWLRVSLAPSDLPRVSERLSFRPSALLVL